MRTCIGGSMWFVWAGICLSITSIGDSKACREADNPLFIVADKNAARLSDGTLYVMREGLTLNCVGGRLGSITWQLWNQSRENWLDLVGESRPIRPDGDTLLLSASTIATTRQWAEDHSTLYRCVSVGRQQLRVSNALYVKFPYYTAAARILHSHHYADCCLSCSQPGLDDEVLKQPNNTKFTITNLMTRKQLDRSRLHMVDEVIACLGQRQTQKGSFQVLEISCVLTKENQIVHVTRGYTLHSHKITLRPAQDACKHPSLTPSFQNISSVWQETRYMECEVEAPPNSTLNAAQFGAVSGSYGYTWYYASLDGKGRASLSVKKGNGLALLKFANKSMISTVLCWMTERTSQCRSITVSLPVGQGTEASTTTMSPVTANATSTVSTASNSTSAGVTDGVTENESVHVKPVKPKTGESSDSEGSNPPLKPSHLIAVSIVGCIIVLVAMLLLILGVKDKCSAAREYQVVQTGQPSSQS